MTKKAFRIIGGIIILFNLWLIGHYQLTGIMILLLTFGVALLFEFVLVKQFASDSLGAQQKVSGGLIKYFGLQQWYETVFDDEQKHRLEERFGTVSGNKLASGAINSKSLDVDVLQFFYDLEQKLKPKVYSDVLQLVDERYKLEAGKFCRIDEDRWNNEKYYKVWFTFMNYRVKALNRLKSDNYFTQGQLDPIDDNYITQPCLDIKNKHFNIINGDLDRAFSKHFSEPIKGCRCSVRGYRKR
uniref:hypothetical protein n=1 Tax=Psychrobacter sp. TaxID=56811 RepID=UPI001597F794|nr:hypothetical protein [Psychrobacter sp.]QJS05345.1 hypothetical protein [Psychrobacter sp.]